MKAIAEEALASTIYEYSLTAAFVGQHMNTGGIMGLHVLENPNFDPVNTEQNVTIRLNDANASPIPLYPGLVIRAAIEEFWVSNAVGTHALAQKTDLKLAALHFNSWNIESINKDPTTDFLQYSIIDLAIAATGRQEYQVPTLGYSFVTIAYQDDITTVIPKMVGVKLLKYADVLKTKLMYASVYMARIFEYRRFQFTIPVKTTDQVQLAIRNFHNATACDASINLTFFN